MRGLRLEDLVRGLRESAQRPSEEGAGPKAAVAIVLREGHEGLDALMIRRAESPDDPWSGHMAFPGGRQEPSDAGPLEAAIRETSEELGLDLRASAEVLGGLAPLDAMARGRLVGLTVYPFVFALHGEAGPLRPNYEVAEALWTPLGPMLRGETRTTFPYPYQSTSLQLPAYRVGERVVWGLTYAMLERLFALAQE